MSASSLAAKYRPQTFAQVVGQEMVKNTLSKAAASDRVAPAYLLSGTRGVGKTTLARIFAKALNCEKAPAAEPCNQCEACRRITQGSFVDVVEIDGASNRGIDDVRRLREAVGYAPMEGRYKVFIIDEAHMLTKEAFNALLKTLEEPPPGVVFVLATTEQHKFPITIISRCQHYVFRHVAENILESHLCRILAAEKQEFEPEAPRLIAKRAAGSVRDAMSLLGQILALEAGEGALTVAQTRAVLGLAGQEALDELLHALHHQDVAQVSALVSDLFSQGVDMSFFLRELSLMWRNLFMVKQAGEACLAPLNQTAVENSNLLAHAQNFSLTYLHAAWQMTLESQRRILTSLDPASALEFLLLNLAQLPLLLPLAELRMPQSPGEQGPPAQGQTSQRVEAPKAPNTPKPAPALAQQPSPASTPNSTPPWATDATPASQAPSAQPSPTLAQSTKLAEAPCAEITLNPEISESAEAQDIANPAAPVIPSWADFLSHCCQLESLPPGLDATFLTRLYGAWKGQSLEIAPPDTEYEQRLQNPQVRAGIEKLLQDWIETPFTLTFLTAAQAPKTQSQRLAQMEEHPVVQVLQETFEGRLVPGSFYSAQ